MPDILYREMPISVETRAAEDGKGDIVRFSASSDTPVMRWGDKEILLHGQENIRLERLLSLGAMLVNHDPNQRAGAVIGATVENGRLMVDGRFLSTDFGQQIKAEVEEGSLRGISVGYMVHEWQIDEEAGEWRATDWEVYEVSFTPIPADASVGVGRAENISEDQWRVLTGRENSAALAAANAQPAEREIMSEENKPQDNAAEIRTGDEAKRAAELADLRQKSERAALENTMRRECDAHGVRFDAINFPEIKTEADGLRAIMAEKAKAEETKTQMGRGASIEVTVDEIDKQRCAATDAIAATITRERIADNPYAGRTLREMGERFARQAGIDTRDWTRKDSAHFFLGEWNQIRDLRGRAANITTSDFTSFVLLDAITKIVANGTEAGATGLVYPLISEVNRVPDFKQTNVGAMGTQNLQETAENIAFPELDKSEGVFNTQAKMWGGTLSLTLQALVNDDTGQFERSLRQAGAIAAKTKEKRAIQKFLLGTSTATATSTWTNNTTSNTTLVYTTADLIADARANIYRGSVDMMNKIGMDGNPLGTIPRFLLCGPTNSTYARGILGNASGQVVANSGDLELLVSPYLELSTLTGYSTTSYYLVADPMLVTGLLQTEIVGFESVQVMEYDTGAVAARAWKLWQPFEFDLFSIANSAATTIIPAAQQCTT